MDDFGMLAKDFGFRPQGKSAPMKSSGGDRRSRPASSSTTLSSDGNDMFDDVFGGPPKYTNNNSKSTPRMSDFDYDSIFKDSASTNITETKAKPSSLNSPVYDKPLYDDDIFDGIPGINSKPVASPASARYEDNIFASMTASPPKQSHRSDQFDDLLGNLGRTEKVEPIRHHSVNSPKDFDDLIPGFGGGSPASSSRWSSEPSLTSTSKTNEKTNAADDPFVVLESFSTPVSSSQNLYTDPMEEISKIGKSRSTKSGISSPIGDGFDDINSFNKSATAFAKETNNRKMGQARSEEGSNMSSGRSSVSREQLDESSFGFPDSQPQKMTFDDFHESSQTSPKSAENVQHADDIWLTVSEIPLFTPVTRAPPPSRPPPLIPKHVKNSEKGSFASSNTTFDNDFSSSSLDSTKYSQNKNIPTNKEEKKDEHAMDEREEEREKARQAVERAKKEARLKAERAAVQRAQTEARERAAIEARERAERAAAEAKERAAAEAKERAAAEAKERAAAEAKERAAAESREKEAREKAAVAKAQAEARRRAERAAVERVTAEARNRAAAEARERMAAAAKMNQQKNDNDRDPFFNTGSTPNTVPNARATSSDSSTDPLSQERQVPDGTHRASGTGAPRKTPSAPNFVDDLNSIFGAASPAGEFQDYEGETEERRRARVERQQRTQERAAKALAEKNQRDLQIQKDQEERQRISTTLDVEIKRWAAGKEGNLRAMLSTLQYVLWPESGWQAISLTDLITGASVKKAYRKATLCIHPDKVQQKGANLQQKYVAEKVFDLLKEAWNKFNSEELF